MSYDVKWVQTALKKLGHYTGSVDGIMGPMTEKAIVQFKRRSGLRARPFIGPITLRKLAKLAQMKDQPSSDALPWINEINKVVGLHELRDNYALSQWLRSDGNFLGDPSKLPWCGDAVETAIRLSLPDETFPTRLAGNPYWARNWAEFGIACGRVYGAVATFQRGSGGHVGFLVGVSKAGGLLRIRGGNQSNEINDTWISASRLLPKGLRWPSSFSTRLQKPAPVLDDTGAVVSTNEE